MEPQMDMQQILAAAQQMQEQLMSAQQQLADAEETARTIADLVLAAVRSAYSAAEDLQQQKMGPFAAAFSGGLPGMPGMPGGLDLPGGLGIPNLGPGTGDDQDA